MARLLACEGYDVSCAANGVEAIEVLKSRAVDLVLLDVMMPRMDGIKFLEFVRGHTELCGLPVIAMTGLMDSMRLGRLRELGVKTIVTKGGFTFEGLLGEIRTHVPEPVE